MVQSPSTYQRKTGFKKLPVVKLFLAILSLVLLSVASKYLFTSTSSKPLESIKTTTTPVVLGAETSQNQTQPASTPAPAPATTNTPVQNLIKVTSTPTGYLNVRDQPSLNGNVIDKVSPGATFPYISQQGGWYLITLNSKRQGWIDGEYTVAAN